MLSQEYNHSYAPMVRVAALAAAYISSVEQGADAMDIETETERGSV
jgi:hypothetical protein